jgi:hypothetical protein
MSPLPPKEDIFVCPTCFRYFRRNALDMDESPITIEHVPPESLGGLPITLTCRICNNWAGRELESSLCHLLDVLEFSSGIPGASVDARVEFRDIAVVNAELEFRPNMHLTIGTSEDRTNPEEILKLKSSAGNNPPELVFNFRGKRGRQIKAKRAECAILRIAYLFAFAQFGYAFIMPSPISQVRSQFLNPDEEILPFWGIARADHLSDDYLGVCFVRKPDSLRSFACVFDLVTSLSKHRYIVLLPGPENLSTDVYITISKQESELANYDLQLLPLQADKRLLTDPSLVFASHWIWGNC